MFSALTELKGINLQDRPIENKDSIPQDSQGTQTNIKVLKTVDVERTAMRFHNCALHSCIFKQLWIEFVWLVTC